MAQETGQSSSVEITVVQEGQEHSGAAVPPPSAAPVPETTVVQGGQEPSGAAVPPPSGEMLREWIKEERVWLILVASLVGAGSFQIGVNPPGGNWPDDLAAGPAPHVAGTAVLASKHPNAFSVEQVCNNLSLMTSVVMIVLLSCDIFHRTVPRMIAMILIGICDLALFITAYVASTNPINIFEGFVHFGAAVGICIGNFLFVYTLRGVWKKLMRPCYHAAKLRLNRGPVVNAAKKAPEGRLSEGGMSGGRVSEGVATMRTE